MKPDIDKLQITPEMLLKAYRLGIFPMAEDAKDEDVFWIEPQHRGIIPLETFHVPRRLKKTIRKQPFTIHVDKDFNGVIEGCAETKRGRPTTWINDQIKQLYLELFKQGHCHTVEAWQDDQLVGGLYGVAINGVFFGESMFSKKTDASKIALVYLVARLIKGGFALLDTQFTTEHLMSFGAREIERDEFQRRLKPALDLGSSDFSALCTGCSPSGILQLVSQTSKTGCSNA